MPSNYKDSKLIVQRLRELHATDEIGDIGDELLFSKVRPAEELYLYRQDRWQIHNVAKDSEYAVELDRHRLLLEDWIKRTNDPGTESDDIYVLETEDQMKANKNEASRRTYRANVEVYRRWAKEGV